MDFAGSSIMIMLSILICTVIELIRQVKRNEEKNCGFIATKVSTCTLPFRNTLSSRGLYQQLVEPLEVKATMLVDKASSHIRCFHSRQTSKCNAKMYHYRAFRKLPLLQSILPSLFHPSFSLPLSFLHCMPTPFRDRLCIVPGSLYRYFPKNFPHVFSFRFSLARARNHYITTITVSSSHA